MIIRHNHGTKAEITIISREIDTEAKPLGAEESRQQPVWHVIVLGALTFNLYLIYWANKTWRLVKHEAADDAKVSTHPGLALFKTINPGLRTVGLIAPLLINFIPLIHPLIKAGVGTAIFLYLLGTLFIGLAWLQPDENSFPRRKPLVATGLVMAFAFAVHAISAMHTALFLLSLLGFSIACGIAQHWLNSYLRSTEDQSLYVRGAFNGFEMVAIILGASLLGLTVAGSMIGIKTP